MNFLKGSAALAVLMAVSLTTACIYAQEEWAPNDMTGIAVGEKAPDFTLNNYDGTKYTLSELTKKGTVALVFYRSANW